MSPKIELTPAAHDYLTRQLDELAEQKIALLDDYFTVYAPGTPVDDRAEVSRFLDDYIESVRGLLRGARIRKTAGKQLPLTFIGCDITVRDTQNNRSEIFRIVSPYKARPSVGHISFLSPVGRSLLLKKPGDTLEVQAPGGTFRYQIISVSYPED